MNQLLHQHQLSLMQLERATSPEERRARSQFARDYAEKIRMARDELGAPAPVHASLNGTGVQAAWSNDGSDPVACVTARVVRMSVGDLKYKVVVSLDGEDSADHLFDTMREAEAFIRRNMPAPAPRSALYDRPGTVGARHVKKSGSLRPTKLRWID